MCVYLSWFQIVDAPDQEDPVSNVTRLCRELGTVTILSRNISIFRSGMPRTRKTRSVMSRSCAILSRDISIFRSGMPRTRKTRSVTSPGCAILSPDISIFRSGMPRTRKTRSVTSPGCAILSRDIFIFRSGMPRTRKTRSVTSPGCAGSWGTLPLCRKGPWTSFLMDRTVNI